MKIATNKLCDLYRFYETELSQLYAKDELCAIFELVCETYLNYTKQDVKLRFNENVNQSDVLKIYDTCLELKKEIPVQYVLKQAFFYDSFFEVSPAVLIPRPETEELVDLIINNLKFKIDNLRFKILDIGTGTGCIPITLKKQLPYSTLVAMDVSEEALFVAKKNAEKHKVEIDFIKHDILNSIINTSFLFDIIVSNPPYINHSEAATMTNTVLKNEPHIALFVKGDDTIIFYKRIIDCCAKHLNSLGYLYFELNPLFAEAVNNYAIESKLFTFTQLINDMSGKKRFFKAQRV